MVKLNNTERLQAGQTWRPVCFMLKSTKTEPKICCI
nr:MAG TPA: hypothetical protein [Caudoviricetes sp.]